MRWIAWIGCAVALAACASDQTSRPRPPVRAEGAAPPPLAGGADVALGPAAVEGASTERAPAAEAATVTPGPTAGEPSQADSTQAADPRALDPILAWVGGRPILTSQLLESLLQRDALGVRSALNVLVSGAIAQQEAARLGLRVPPPLVAEATTRHLDELRIGLVGEDADLSDLDSFIRDRLDLDPARYRERLRNDTIRELVTERVVRAWILAQEYARVRMLLLQDAEDVPLMLERLEAGATFEGLAEQHSIDRTGERGGLVPFLVRNDRAPLARLAFDTPVGEVGGPIELAGAFVLLLVEDRPDPVDGDWNAIGIDVEDSLLDEPVSDEEWLVWQLAMERRYGIDVEPFYDFVAEPVRR
ncbi:MAG: peptidylprolyl isomerase [Planctomycetota bacterium]